MEVTFNLGYGSNAKTVKVDHDYQSVRFNVVNGNDEMETKFSIPTYQLLAIVEVFERMETKQN